MLSFRPFLLFHLLLVSGFRIPSLEAAAHRTGLRVLVSGMQHFAGFWVSRVVEPVAVFYSRNEVYFGVVELQLNVFGLQGRRRHDFKTKFGGFSLNGYKNKYLCVLSWQANKENWTRRDHVWSLSRRPIRFVRDFPKRGRDTFKARLWKGIKIRRFNQIQNIFADLLQLH